MKSFALWKAKESGQASTVVSNAASIGMTLAECTGCSTLRLLLKRGLQIMCGLSMRFRRISASLIQVEHNCGASVIRSFFIFTFFFVLPYPALGQKDVSVKTINEIKRSIIPIVCGYVDEQNAFQIAEVAGTGFFVDLNGRFITDAHVLDGWDEINRTRHPCFPAIYIPDQGWNWKSFEPQFHFQWFPFIGCESDSAVDLAVCHPNENPFTSKRVLKKNIAVVSFDLQTWPEGTAIAFTGFPLESKSPISSEGFIAGFQLISESIKGFDYFVDKAAWPGASGSPLYLANGKVIGIIRQRGQNAGSGISLARSATVISDFLSKHPYTTKQP